MMIPIEYILLGASILLLLSIIASRISGRLGIPVLLLFLVIGMLAGSEGPGGIYFDDPRLAQSLGIVALAFIIFAGGLDTTWGNIRPLLWRGLALSTLGVFITALLVGCFATFVLDFSLLESLLLGGLVSSTDAAAVFTVLRTKKVHLKGRLRSLLELESGSNDPMAIFLTIGLIYLLVNPTVSVVNLIPMFIRQMGLGAIMGYAMGKGMILLIKRLRLEYEGLYPVLSLSLVLLAYGATTSLGGNGFLAVYLAGVIVGNSDFIRKKSLMRFHDGLAWLMQIAMFLILGLLVFPSHLVPVAAVSLLISVFLMFIARPISVFVSLLFTKMSLREKTMVSWVGLRGAVPIILATFPLLSDVPNAELMFNVVFFVVLTSALFQGWSIPVVARLLKVDTPFERERHYPIELVPTQGVDVDLVEFIVPRNSAIVGKSVVELSMPQDSLVVLINRNDQFLVPSSGTVLEEEDSVLALVNKHNLSEVRALFLKQGKSTET
jgi:cell volume regulation protein A